MAKKKAPAKKNGKTGGPMRPGDSKKPKGMSFPAKGGTKMVKGKAKGGKGMGGGKGDCSY